MRYGMVVLALVVPMALSAQGAAATKGKKALTGSDHVDITAVCDDVAGTASITLSDEHVVVSPGTKLKWKEPGNNKKVASITVIAKNNSDWLYDDAIVWGIHDAPGGKDAGNMKKSVVEKHPYPYSVQLTCLKSGVGTTKDPDVTIDPSVGDPKAKPADAKKPDTKAPAAKKP